MSPLWKRLYREFKSRLPLKMSWGRLSSMIRANVQPPAVRQRLNRLTTDSVSRAFAISLAFHGLVFGTIEMGHRAGWWNRSLLSSLAVAKKKLDPNARDQQKNSLAESSREIPLVFVEVDPAQAVEQAPEQAKYYSSRSSRAANKEAVADLNVPRITGTQDKMPKTVENAPLRPMPLQPAPVPENKPEPQPLQPDVEPKAGPHPGDLAMAKPSENPKVLKEAINPEQKETTPPSPRRSPPRRLSEVKVAQAGSPGERMKQEGGTKRFSVDGLDVKATPFGSYDAAVIEAIRQRWYDLLDERDFARGYSGKVVLTFRMNSDGSVTQMHVAENEVSDILAFICQRAVSDPQKYPPWPSDMRRLVGADYREVRFTFHYN